MDEVTNTLSNNGATSLQCNFCFYRIFYLILRKNDLRQTCHATMDGR